MGFMVGFGDHHVDKTIAFARSLGSLALSCEYDKIGEAVQAAVAELAPHHRNGKDWRSAMLRHFGVDGWRDRGDGLGDRRTVTIEACYSHYRNDHPFSPDGFAMWQIPFVVVAMRDNAWPDRVYVSTDSTEGR